MNILPPSFKFDGDRNKAISLKAYAGQFYNLITTQAAKEGVPHVTRTKRFPDGTVINFKAQKNSLFNNWSGRVEIFAAPSERVTELPPVGSIAYWYNLNTIFRQADGAIYSSKPIFSTEPFLELGTTSLINSSINTFLMKSPKVFDNMKSTPEGALLFNTDYELAGTAKASSFTDSNLIVSTDMSDGTSVVSTGTNTVDGFYSPAYSFVTSVTQSGSSALGYLDKIVGDTLTNKLKIDYNTSPTKLIITVYHDTLGTVVKTLTSEIPSFIYRSNPRFVYLHLSPDASFLSAGIQFNAEVGAETNSSVYLHTDIVIKLDSNGVWADPASDITHSTTNNTSISVDTPSKSDYRDSIDLGVSISINSFKFQESVIRDRVTHPTSFGTSSYTDLHCAITTPLIHTQAFFPFTQYTVVNQGSLAPGSFETDLEALFNYPILTSSYTYGDSRTSCFTAASFTVDLSAAVGVPNYHPSIALNSTDGGALSIRFIEEIPVSGGDLTETFTIVKKGSPVYGIIYDKSKYIDNQYIRYWIDGRTKFVNKEGVEVLSTVSYEEHFDVRYIKIYFNIGSSLTNFWEDDSTITVHSPDDITTLNSLSLHRFRIGTVSTDTTNMNELSVNGIIIANLRQGGVQRFPLDTSITTYEEGYTSEWTYSSDINPVIFQYTPIHPYCKDITEGSTTAPTNNLFGNVLSSNATSDYAFVINSNEEINILTSRPTVIPFNKIVDATLTGTAANIAKFTNGFQVNRDNYQRISKEIIENSLYSTGIIEVLSVSIDSVQTNPSIPSRSAVVPDVLGISPGPSSTQSVLDTAGQVLYQGTITRGFYYKFKSGDYIASVQTNFGSLYPSKAYYVILNGIQMPDLLNITAFNSFTASSRFGIGFSI